MPTLTSKPSLRVQMGPFAAIPVWVLERCQDSRAIHLYAWLAKHANRERRAWPTNDHLAAAMGGISVRSIERAIAELRSIGAITTERKRRRDGAVIGLDFVLMAVDPNDEADAEELPDTGGGLQKQLPDTGGGKVERSHSATGVGVEPVHPATGVAAIPPPVSFAYKEQPDPVQPDPRTREGDGRADAQPPLLSIQTAAPTPDDLAALWNAGTTRPLPRCESLTPKRRRHATARLAEHPFETWRRIVERVEASGFCRGQNERGWVASFAWLIGSPDVAVKVLEGNYADREKPERPFTAQELRDAERVRANWLGCQHEPRCDSHQACLATIIRQWRIQRGEAA